MSARDPYPSAWSRLEPLPLVARSPGVVPASPLLKVLARGGRHVVQQQQRIRSRLFTAHGSLGTLSFKFGLLTRPHGVVPRVTTLSCTTCPAGVSTSVPRLQFIQPKVTKSSRLPWGTSEARRRHKEAMAAGNWRLSASQRAALNPPRGASSRTSEKSVGIVVTPSQASMRVPDGPVETRATLPPMPFQADGLPRRSRLSVTREKPQPTVPRCHASSWHGTRRRRIGTRSSMGPVSRR